MKLKYIFRAIFIFTIALFVCISLDFSMISASSKSSVKTAPCKNSTENSDAQLKNENIAEINWTEPVLNYRRDLLNFNTNITNDENFISGIYGIALEKQLIKCLKY